jgi:hypothetical protein
MFESPNMGPTLRTQQRAINQAEDARKKAKKDVQKGIDKGSVPLTEATQIFDPLIGQKQGAYDMYQNSLGLNGQEGYDATVGAFQQGPGYQFALDQANQNVMRNNAALGGLASGNTLMGLADRAQQLQNLEFGNWQDRLKGEDPTQLYGMKGNALTNLGKFFGDMYTNKGQVGIQGAELANNAYQSLAGGQMTNANNQAAANNALPGMLLQGGLNALGGYFGA